MWPSRHVTINGNKKHKKLHCNGNYTFSVVATDSIASGNITIDFFPVCGTTAIIKMDTYVSSLCYGLLRTFFILNNIKHFY